MIVLALLKDLPTTLFAILSMDPVTGQGPMTGHLGALLSVTVLNNAYVALSLVLTAKPGAGLIVLSLLAPVAGALLALLVARAVGRERETTSSARP